MKHTKILFTTLFALFISTVMFTACQKEESPLVIQEDQNETEPVSNVSKLQAPTVPTALEVPAGNRLYFRVYATGSQIYVDSLTSTGVWAWILRAPSANLYLTHNFYLKVGTHYVGPTWGNNHGTVLGAKLASAPSPTPTAIPWLLIQKVSTAGTGIYTKATYIQRINTVGGLAPATLADAAHAGQVEAVPYTAEYYFYRTN